MKAKIALIVFLIFILLNYPSKAWAARDIIISSDKSSLFGEEYATITASASGFTNGEAIYIKGAFYQDGDSNYFGYTKNGENWIKNGESTLSQRSILIGSWDNRLIIKSDFSDSGFNGEGSYKFKVGFYYITSGGNISSVNWSTNNIDIALNEPDPTPTISSTPTVTSTPKPTNLPTSSVTNTPTVTKSISKTPTPTPQVEKVLGSSTKSSVDNSVKTQKEEGIKVAKESNSLLPIVFISIGVIFLLACVIVFLYPKIKEKQNNINE